MKDQKSYYPKQSECVAEWLTVDATDQTLGRLASEIAKILRGKHKPTFAPSADTGDFVIVTNAEKIKVTGKKLTDKKYYKFSGFPGGLKEMSLKQGLEKDASEIIRMAVKGMLPSNIMGRSIINKVKIYNGSEHPHEAQNPRVITLSNAKLGA
jgi:large subunit ribosomal protein L13